MIYAIKAPYISTKLAEFHQKLIDGTIAAQKPDGREIVESMRRATITEPGLVQWSERSFCSPPLAHERQTIYDRYFTDMEIEPVAHYMQFEGKPFMEVMDSEQPSEA